MWLVLFDVDGTLFLTDDQLANEAAVAAVRDVYGIDLPADCVSQVDHPGRTTRSIFREVLLRAGLDPEEVDRGLDRWCRRNSERYLALLEGRDTGFWEATSGAAETLDRLAGTARLERLGLARASSRAGKEHSAARPTSGGT